MNWDDAYSNSAYIPGGDTYPVRWAEAAAAFRAGARALLDRPYGGGAREVYDLFLPAGPPRGTVVFIHGGYWLAFDKSSWSHLAAGPLAHGWAVAMPSYTLCPEARIGEIVRQIGRAVSAIAAQSPGEIRLTGHSAGGHLATRLCCAQSPFQDRVAKVLSISGLHDLRPLMQTSMNAKLHLDAAEAAAESPALLMPRDGTVMTAWVGADERPEFLRQTALLANIWAGLGAETRQAIAPGRHHYDVIDDLAQPDSPMVAELLSN
ncbi:MAG TPA: alpha/beta hydrolase [Magnetospirillaceae bacterium]|nr:alpha/beta hydrolase [Magnetospirillaceae bacterium]